MKLKLIITSLFLSLAFVSCKDQEKKEDVQAVEEVAAPPTAFVVKMEAIVKKDDQMILYFQDENIPWFDEEHTVWANVKGSNDPQVITFVVPEEYIPTNFRFDISNNMDQEPIQLKSMTVAYVDKSFTIDSKNIDTFFAMNDFVKYDAATQTFVLSKNDKGVYDPFFIGKEAIFPDIKKITGKQ